MENLDDSPGTSHLTSSELNFFAHKMELEKGKLFSNQISGS